MDPIERFLEVLVEATAAIDNPYFALPIQGQDLPIYRERVYCYELYHQLRSRWPSDWPYVVNGEVDKIAHPIMRGQGIENTKPDLLVHTPGDMNGNLVIIEVKTIDVNDIRGISRRSSHSALAVDTAEVCCYSLVGTQTVVLRSSTSSSRLQTEPPIPQVFASAALRSGSRHRSQGQCMCLGSIE